MYPNWMIGRTNMDWFRTSERRLNLVLDGKPTQAHRSIATSLSLKRSLCRAALISGLMRATVAALLVASYRVGHSLKLGRALSPWGPGALRDGRCACSRQVGESRCRVRDSKAQELKQQAERASRFEDDLVTAVVLLPLLRLLPHPTCRPVCAVSQTQECTC